MSQMATQPSKATQNSTCLSYSFSIKIMFCGRQNVIVHKTIFPFLPGTQKDCIFQPPGIWVGPVVGSAQKIWPRMPDLPQASP